MAVMNFCGATGKMFRGRVTEKTEWEKCVEAERPVESSCLQCPLYLQAFRRHNNEPYRYGRVVVAGKSLDKKQLRENRLHCGRGVRNETPRSI